MRRDSRTRPTSRRDEPRTLSFDNGPTPGITEGVLEVLARYGLLSTFFVIGQRLEAPRNAALLQAISAAGHWIGNHTWSHSVAFGDRPDAACAREEIDRAPTASRGCEKPIMRCAGWFLNQSTYLITKNWPSRRIMVTSVLLCFSNTLG